MDRDALSRTPAVVRTAAVAACVLVGACKEPPPKQTDAVDDATKPKPKAASVDGKAPDAKAIVAPGIAAQFAKARRESACVQAMQIRQAVEMFRVTEGGKCPASVAALVERKFLPDLPKDPWKHEYSLRCEGEAVTVSSPGRDGAPGTEDDVVQDGSDAACDG